jgi:hypothetical protein
MLEGPKLNRWYHHCTPVSIKKTSTNLKLQPFFKSIYYLGNPVGLHCHANEPAKPDSFAINCDYNFIAISSF